MKPPSVRINTSYIVPKPPSWHNRDLAFKNKAKFQPKRAVFCIDHGQMQYSSITTASICKYATKVGADLHIIRWLPAGKDYPIVWHKYDAKELLDKGYQVLIIDNDCVITDACPDLFYMCDTDHIYTMDQRVMQASDKDCEIGIQHACKKMGLPYKAGPVLNAGVILANPAAAEFFKFPAADKLNDVWLFEQDYLTVLVRNKPGIWRPLPIEANMWSVSPGQVPWIVHAAGRETKDKYTYLAAFA